VRFDRIVTSREETLVNRGEKKRKERGCFVQAKAAAKNNSDEMAPVRP
jgi:hypothetical protein